MNLNIPTPATKRVVVIGGGFGGLSLVKGLRNSGMQIVMLDRNNFHQFQPLLYQVATAGLEPTAIAFPIRKLLARHKDFHFRMTEVTQVRAEQNIIVTTDGELSYDYLVMATGTDTNYFGIESVRENAMPLKSIGEALALRNRILSILEKAQKLATPENISSYLNIVIVGGGPTGVELAGAVAELRNTIFPKDYPEIDFNLMHIYLVNASGRLLEAFSLASSAEALSRLEAMGVEVMLNTAVKQYDGATVSYGDSGTITSELVVWVGGVAASYPDGISSQVKGRGGRLKTDLFNRIEGYDNIFAIGDIALISCEKYPAGHPQVAQVAIQQGRNLAMNLLKGDFSIPFSYYDKGSMATIGRDSAVAEISRYRFKGFIAWVLWLAVHLLFIIGVRNRLTVLFDWGWSYITYDRPLRTIIEARHRPSPASTQKREPADTTPTNLTV